MKKRRCVIDDLLYLLHQSCELLLLDTLSSQISKYLVIFIPSFSSVFAASRHPRRSEWVLRRAEFLDPTNAKVRDMHDMPDALFSFHPGDAP